MPILLLRCGILSSFASLVSTQVDGVSLYDLVRGHVPLRPPCTLHTSDTSKVQEKLNIMKGEFVDGTFESARTSFSPLINIQ